MKTVLTRLKTLVQDNLGGSNTLSYVVSAEIVHPQIDLSKQFIAGLPKVLITPNKTSESWVSTQKKESKNVVNAYLLMMYHTRETGIIGDSTRSTNQGKGIVDFVEDFVSVVRGHRLSVDGTKYLDRPLDILGITYNEPIVINNAHLLLASVSMQCNYLFNQATLPGNI